MVPLSELPRPAEPYDAVVADATIVAGAFPDAAQQIGLERAFAKYGIANAVNLGGGNMSTFVVGAEAIGRTIGAQIQLIPSPVSRAPDLVIAASSGDLAVTIGMIRATAPPPPGQPAATPFFTVWRRASANAPCRCVAE